MKFYAEKLKTSVRELSLISVRYSGKTPKKMITYRRIIEAKRILLYEQESIKTIADMLGFHNQFQFSKFFKENTGVSPLYFRLQNKKKII
ncbi:helix-turn-helix domain-containing protein [Chryseobacterium limigenitum]|uniref:helix-turn-helix domain-containing protein n=1 Tax=Chryseobacterium limigenitum TaxID=1612149 RepID=UPI00373FC83C